MVHQNLTELTAALEPTRGTNLKKNLFPEQLCIHRQLSPEETIVIIMSEPFHTNLCEIHTLSW